MYNSNLYWHIKAFKGQTENTHSRHYKDFTKGLPQLSNLPSFSISATYRQYRIQFTTYRLKRSLNCSQMVYTPSPSQYKIDSSLLNHQITPENTPIIRYPNCELVSGRNVTQITCYYQTTNTTTIKHFFWPSEQNPDSSGLRESETTNFKYGRGTCSWSRTWSIRDGPGRRRGVVWTLVSTTLLGFSLFDLKEKIFVTFQSLKFGKQTG